MKIKGQWKSFRHLPYIKVFHIALIWSLSTVGLVYVESVNNLENIAWGSLLYLLSCKFLEWKRACSFKTCDLVIVMLISFLIFIGMVYL